MSTSPVVTTATEPVAPSTTEAFPAGRAGRSNSGGEPGPARHGWRRKREDTNPWRAEILARLAKPGCLVCSEERENLSRYYFWFLNEQYASIPTIERLQRSRGFCLRHTRHLLEHGGPGRVSAVGEYVLRSATEWLRAIRGGAASGHRTPRGAQGTTSDGFRPPVGCPGCEAERETRERYAWVIVSCLEEADIRAAFRASYGLCLPHFLEAAPLARWDTLQFLVEEQLRHVEEARAGLAEIGADGAEAKTLPEALRRLYGPDLDAAIRPFLATGQGGGTVPVTPAWEPDVENTRTSATWSPAFEDACRLLAQPGCSLCRVAAGGRETYLAWLEREIRECLAIEYRWNQAQLLCPEHAWLFADRCGPEVLTAACGLLLDRVRESLRGLLWDIRQPIPARFFGRMGALPSRWRQSVRPDGPERGGLRTWPRVARTLRTLWQGPRGFLDHALTRHLWRGACPLCHHLQTIEGRAADRLLAVLRDAEGRRSFQRSYGLCLRHAPLLLERAADSEMRREIAEVLLARVEVDGWEATEYLRRLSWSVRHEPKAAEGAAWLRAMTRIAGVAMEQPYGF